MQRILTNQEIKTLTGNGSANDVLVEMWNDAATEVVCQLLEIQDLGRHSIVDERVNLVGDNTLILDEFPVDLTQPITLRNTFDHGAITGFTCRSDSGKIRTIRLYDSNGSFPFAASYDTMFVSYVAGYNTQDTVEVLSIASLAEKTISVTIAGVITVYTFKASGATGDQINVGVDTAATAANIMAKLGGSVVGSTVTLPLGSKILLGNATIAQLGIVNANVPASIKNAIALVAGGGIAEKQKAGGVVSYTIGGKSLTFRNNDEATAVEMVINNYLSAYKKVNIIGI